VCISAALRKFSNVLLMRWPKARGAGVSSASATRVERRSREALAGI
jgi:hypothetical protein